MEQIETLSSSLVRLEPLASSHIPDLLAASSNDRSSFALTDVPADFTSMVAYVESALEGKATGTMIPFVTILQMTGEVVGTTRFGHIEYWRRKDDSGSRDDAHDLSFPDAVEIGWTWLTPSAQRKGINREAKLLMLTLAFEKWKVRRVTLRTDSRNTASRHAILRLGARLDGVLRAAQLGYDGNIRDNAMYSILDSEWEQAKSDIVSSLSV